MDDERSGSSQPSPDDWPPPTADQDDRSATARRHADRVGAVCLALGLVGTVAWVWAGARASFGADRSFAERLDDVVATMPLLLLSVLSTGAGSMLRNAEPAERGHAVRALLHRPVSALLLIASVLLIGVVGLGTIVDRDDEIDISVALDDARARLLWQDVERLVPAAPPTLTTVPAPTYTLEVHSDGCGVFRSGEIGDDLSWVIEDSDGFEVLSRNAAGETQYRYFRPGTYTVTLETWGGGYYITVSNAVTITC